MPATRWPAIAPLVSFLMLGSAFAQTASRTSGSPPWKAQVCEARHTCTIAKVTPAGRSAAGISLAVAEIQLGLADKPHDAPPDGCRTENGANNGGVEFWLIEGEKPRQLLKLCNDGYGASGIGEDKVEISTNRFAHTQSGGSNDRWEESKTVQLSPPRILNFSNSTYRATDPDFHSESHADVATMTTKVTAATKEGDLRGFALPIAGMDKDTAPGKPLGDCAMKVGAENLNEFITFGKLDPERKPELRLLVLSKSEMLIQVYDPKPAQPGGSWVNSDHVEIWTTRYSEDMDSSPRPNPEKVMQIGIALDGQVYPGVGQPAVPQVLASAARDESGRNVTLLDVRWLAAKNILDLGVVVVYSQADGGRQTRLFATAPIRRNRPTYLPNVVEMPVECGIRDGRRSVTSYSVDLAR